MKTNNFTKKALVAAVSLGLAQLTSANAPQVKVDLDVAGRQAAEVLEPGYLPWVIKEIHLL